MSEPDIDGREPTEAVVDSLRGARFVTRYQSRAHLHRLHPVRAWRLLLGLALLVFGIINVFIPGPGGSVLILAALLMLAGESHLLARTLDWTEVRYARQVDWALDHKLLAMLIASSAALVFVTGMGYLYTQVR